MDEYLLVANTLINLLMCSTFNFCTGQCGIFVFFLFFINIKDQKVASFGTQPVETHAKTNSLLIQIKGYQFRTISKKKWDANTTLASHKHNTTIGYNVNWNSWNSLQIPKKWVLCIFLRLNAIDIWSKRFAGFPRKISYETKMNLYYTWICKGRIIVASPCIKSNVCKWKKQSKYKQIKKIGYIIYKKWWTLCGKTGVLLGIFHYNLQRKHTGGALSNKHLKDIDSLS